MRKAAFKSIMVITGVSLPKTFNNCSHVGECGYLRNRNSELKVKWPECGWRRKGHEINRQRDNRK